MRILTQNKTELLQVDNFMVNDKAEIIGYSVVDSEHGFLLGTYNNLEEAKNILTLIFESSKLTDFYIMPNSISIVNINELDLSIRSYNILKTAGYKTVGDIIENKSELPFIKKIGKKTLKEINEAIEPYINNYENRL